MFGIRWLWWLVRWLMIGVIMVFSVVLMRNVVVIVMVFVLSLFICSGLSIVIVLKRMLGSVVSYILVVMW